MTGPGKYDELCTKVRQEAEAEAAIVLIFGGNKGSGFSCQLPLELIAKVPSMLRTMADQIEADSHGS